MDPSKQRGEVAGLRAQIDALDRDLVELMARRIAVASAIGEHKAILGSGIVDAGREREVRFNAHRHAQERLPAALLDVHTELMLRAARAVQSGVALRVAHLGPVGTHSEAASRAWFPRATLVPCPTLRDTVLCVGTDADLAVVPWWNHLSGPVLETHQALTEVGRTVSPVLWSHVPVRHVLASRDGDTTVRRIFTRLEPWLASRAQVAGRYPDAQIDFATSNGEAARLAAREPGCAAVTTSAAAGYFSLRVLIDGVDGEDNMTTFGIFEPSRHSREGRSIRSEDDACPPRQRQRGAPV